MNFVFFVLLLPAYSFVLLGEGSVSIPSFISPFLADLVLSIEVLGVVVSVALLRSAVSVLVGCTYLPLPPWQSALRILGFFWPLLPAGALLQDLSGP
jgi:hypothetical protein